VDPLAAKVMAASGGAARVVVSGIAGLIALLRRADLFVGGDSGPTHLAAALAVPTIAIFGPTDPERNGPWGPGVCRVVRDAASVNSYKRTAEVELGLSKLSVATVMEAVKAVSSE
jgi:heptosyltransferase-1